MYQSRVRAIYGFLLMAIGLSLASHDATASYPGHYETTTCACQDLNALWNQADARAAYLTITRPTLLSYRLIVTSETAAVGAEFQVVQRQGEHSVSLVDADLSPRFMAHAIGIVEIPSSVAQSASGAVFEDVNSYLKANYPITIASRWPTLVPGLYILDKRTGQLHAIVPGDTIRVKFADGSTAVMKFTGMFRETITWEVVPESLRGPDGQPYPGGGGGGGGSGPVWPYPWWPDYPPDRCIPGEVCVDGHCQHAC